MLDWKISAEKYARNFISHKVAKLYNISHIINRFKIDIENALGSFSTDCCNPTAELYTTSDPLVTPQSHISSPHELKVEQKNENFFI